jgi:hypothetical protein
MRDFEDDGWTMPPITLGIVRSAWSGVVRSAAYCPRGAGHSRLGSGRPSGKGPCGEGETITLDRPRWKVRTADHRSAHLDLCPSLRPRDRCSPRSFARVCVFWLWGYRGAIQRRCIALAGPMPAGLPGGSAGARRAGCSSAPSPVVRGRSFCRGESLRDINHLRTRRMFT